MKLVITGASGFIGKALLEESIQQGDEVLAVTRNGNFFNRRISEISMDTLISDPQIINGYDAVIHAAGLAHGNHIDGGYSEEEEMYLVNTKMTCQIAEITFKNSGARLIFLSSLSVYGKDSSDVAITERSDLNPITAYGRSKLEAERAISVLASIYNGRYSIVRPPLVYGEGAPANFGMLVKLARTPFPLPFGHATAQRSNIGVKNLADFLRLLADGKNAPNETYVISDNGVNSLRDLIAALRNGDSRLIPVSPQLIQLVLNLLGKKRMGQQLFSPLAVDWNKAKMDLDWEPKYSFNENMRPIVKIG